jgi:hypothetical protein
MIGFIGTLVTISLNCNQCSAITDLHNLQFTVAHALGLSGSTSRLLATDFNTETITSNHYEVFLSSLTLYSSVLICTQLIFTIHQGHAPFSPLYSLHCTNQCDRHSRYYTWHGPCRKQLFYCCMCQPHRRQLFYCCVAQTT